MYWTVPLIWSGQAVAVIEGGPSLTQETIDSLRDMKRIVINDRYRMDPHADMLFAEDSIWWHNNPEALKFQGLKVGMEQIKGIIPNLPRDVLVLRNTGVDGFDPDPGAIRTGSNSGYGAIHVAAHAGASEVHLYGFDLHDKNGKVYTAWVDKLTKLRVELARRGVAVILKTPGSSLPW